MNNLAENLLASHLLFEEKNDAPDFIEKLRKKALEDFQAQGGFPTKKEEEWKYTNLNPSLKKEYKIFPKSGETVDYKDIKPFLLDDIESYKIVFVNGYYSSHLSNTTHEDGDICILSSAISQSVYHGVLENYYGKIAPSENMVNLNTAYAKQGAFIHIPKNVIPSKPVEILYFSTREEPTFYNPRNLVVVEDNAQVRIIESHYNLADTEVFTNSVTEIKVGNDARVDFYKLQNDVENSTLVDNTHVSQEKSSIASVHTFSFGGKLTRNNLHFYQKGEHCDSILKGISLIDGEQLVDHHTLVDHEFPNCESHEEYKGLFKGNSKGVFNGKVYVHAEAQKINAYQQNNNILLSDGASIDTKPQLEIFADDVRCSHGCTVGQMDESALFYLQSRGIPKQEAEALLTYAFSSDVMGSVKITPLKQKVNKLMAQKLGVSVDFEI